LIIPKLHYKQKQILLVKGILLFANNKTPKWLDSKSLEERHKLLKVHSTAPELYGIQRLKMLEARSKMLQAKQLEFEQMQQRKLKEKEYLTESTVTYGLWQTNEKKN